MVREEEQQQQGSQRGNQGMQDDSGAGRSQQGHGQQGSEAGRNTGSSHKGM